MAFQIIRRRRQRLNIIFGSFFISVCIGNIINMIYARMPLYLEPLIKILHFLTLFFMFFAIILIPIVNMIILESTLIFSIKRQNRYILSYGLLLLFGMLILLLFQEIFGWPVGFEIEQVHGFPIWSPIFFIYVISITTGFAIIPIILTNWRIYKSFETKTLKKKWLYYFIGSLGVFCIAYSIMIANLLSDQTFRLIISIFGISIVLWVQMMYYGIVSKLEL